MIRPIPGLVHLASTVACAVSLVAQMPEEHGGHAERLGRIRFATSCRGAAQSGVEHGVAYLHSFWYEKAVETFRAAAAEDSTCAMAFWGQAMSLLHPLWTPPSSADAQVAMTAIDRGLAHYLIHTNDVPQLAEHGLYAARRYAEIAPDVPHAQHMPSHIFTRLGLWDDDIASNTRSAAAARAYEVDRGLTAMWDQRAHSLDYLEYGYLQGGRDTAARRVVDEAAAAPAGYPAGSLTHEYAFAAIPARFALERGQWAEAARLAVRPAPEWPAAAAITHFARAIGAARGGDTAVARRELLVLAQIESTLTASGGPQAYWAGQVAVQRLAARAWLEVATGDTAAAIRHAGQAADREDGTQKHPVTPGPILPARELEGDLALLVGKPAAAAKAYAATLVLSPNRARSLFGLAHAAELTGDAATALASYHQLLTLMAKADGGRPEIAIARRAVASR